MIVFGIYIYGQVFINVFEPQTPAHYIRSHIMDRVRISAHWVSCSGFFNGGGRGGEERSKRQKWRVFYLYATEITGFRTHKSIYIYTLIHCIRPQTDTFYIPTSIPTLPDVSIGIQNSACSTYRSLQKSLARYAHYVN